MDTTTKIYGPRAARKARGLTPKQVAAWAEISVETVRKIERNWERTRDGETLPSGIATVEMAELIALALTRLAPSFPPVGIDTFITLPPGSVKAFRSRCSRTPRPARYSERAVSSCQRVQSAQRPQSKTPRQVTACQGAGKDS